MAQKIDWSRMNSDLEAVLVDVSKEARESGISVTITQGKQPPRIYAEFYYPEEMQRLRRDMSSDGEAKHAELALEFSQSTLGLAQIMKKHGLKGYNADPHYRGRDSYTTVFGFDHSTYKITN